MSENQRTLEEQLSYEEQMESLNKMEVEAKDILDKAEAFERLYATTDFQKVFGEKAMSEQAYRYMSFLHVQKGEQKDRTNQMLEGLSFMNHYMQVQLALKEQSQAKLEEIQQHRYYLDHPEEFVSDEE